MFFQNRPRYLYQTHTHTHTHTYIYGASSRSVPLGHVSPCHHPTVDLPDRPRDPFVFDHGQGRGRYLFHGSRPAQRDPIGPRLQHLRVLPKELFGSFDGNNAGSNQIDSNSITTIVNTIVIASYSSIFDGLGPSQRFQGGLGGCISSHVFVGAISVNRTHVENDTINVTVIAIVIIVAFVCGSARIIVFVSFPELPCKQFSKQIGSVQIHGHCVLPHGQILIVVFQRQFCDRPRIVH
mmetsp:Transcript_12233/g.25791  ORF Transcript_12233/g.25791 Transcript_12233/m.25791 type:complete len:237 (-) Transcript_12233:781-1491(-)